MLGSPLREVEIFALRTKERQGGSRILLSSLRRLFHETKEELKEHPPPNRRLHDRQRRKLRYILSKKYVDGDVLKFVTKLKSASRILHIHNVSRRGADKQPC